MMRTITAAVFLLMALPALLLGGVGGQTLQPVPASPDTVGPDAWGYTAVRHNEPGGPAFNWVDITTRGTQVTGLGDDNFVGPFPMQLQFPYYWYTVDRFYVGSNGYINFSAPGNFAPPFAALPNTTNPNDMLAICVGDLVLSGQAGAGGQVYYWTNAVDSVVVSFINVTEWEQTINPNTRHTFQVVLNKADSSITYQYGRQEGRYNSTNNTRLCIGIENATGQIGVNYVYSTAPPHAALPDSGHAIRFKRTVNTGLQITDAGIVGGFNAGNIGKVVNQGVADTIKTIAKNFGTATLSNVRITYQISRALETYRDTVFIASMAPSSEQTVVFPRLFTPTVTGSYTARFDAFVTGDVGPGNNTKTAEIYSAPFAVGQSTRLQFEGGTASGSINWIGGGGMGVMFDSPLYPVQIETVWVQVSSITANPMLVQVLDGSNGSPGTVLAETSITAVVGLNAINLTGRNIRINSGRWFVGGRGQMAFTYETTAPISFRSWEYTGGWAPYRSGDLQDVIIRCSVRPQIPSIAPNPDEACYAGPIPAYPAGMFGHASAALGDTLYIVGGSSTGAPSTAVYTYSISTKTWGTGTSLPTAKSGGDLVALGGSLYYIGGGLTAISAGDATQYKYTPGAGWTTIANIPTPVTGNTAEAWGDSVIICVAGGWTTYLTTVQVYRPGSNTWSTSTPLPVGRRTHAMGLWDNKIFIAAGFSGAFRKDFYVGTIGANANTITWALGPEVPMRGVGSSRPGGHAVNGRFYFVTGETSPAPAPQDSVYIWDVSGAAWLPQIITGRGGGAGSNYWGVVSSTVTPNNVRIWIPGGSVTGTTQWGLYVLTDDCRIVDVEEIPASVPTEFGLSQNFPNPFNPTTTIQYSLPRASSVNLQVFNILGQQVMQLQNEVVSPGVHNIVWNGQNRFGQPVASGVYFYRLEAKPVDGRSPFSDIRKMLLLK